MNPAQAARLLGVPVGADAETLRAAYRAQIRVHHPDRAGAASSGRAADIIAAYRLLLDLPEAAAGSGDGTGATTTARESTRPGPGAGTAAGAADPFVRIPRADGPGAGDLAPAVHRLDGDALLLEAPADEAFRWLLDAAHDVGEITYVDRSMPILEVLCRFVDEPATSLLLTLQGRDRGTEVFCTVESIEARPAPPSDAVVDLLELALHRRHHPQPPT